LYGYENQLAVYNAILFLAEQFKRRRLSSKRLRGVTSLFKMNHLVTITLVYNNFDPKHLTAISYVKFAAEYEYEVR